MHKNKIIKYCLSVAIAFAMAFSFAAPSLAQPRTDFFDISHWNGGNDGLPLSFYQTLKQGDVNAVVIKVSEGQNYIDPAAAINITNSKTSGLITNAYHFFRANNVFEAKQEARFFDKALKYVGFQKLHDGIVAVDVESVTAGRNTMTNSVNAFVDEMHKLGYLDVALYSGSSFYNNNLIPSRLDVDSTWLARYSASFREPIFYPGQRDAWQWSSSYRIGNFGRFDVNQDFTGKFTNLYRTPNSLPTGIVGQIGNVSLVNYMKQKGYKDTSFNYRTKLAVSYGVVMDAKSYRGTAAQNLALLSKLKSGVKPRPIKVNKPAPSKQSTYTYKVRSGDYLSKIAKEHNISLSRIVSLNNIKNPNRIYVGQVLKLTGSTTKPQHQSSSVARTYTVKRGDTLGKIASSHHTTVSRLASLNHIKNVNIIYPGQKLRISATSTPSASSSLKYKVKRGDTLWEIAQHYHTTVSHLKSMNNLHSDLIFPNHYLRVR